MTRLALALAAALGVAGCRADPSADGGRDGIERRIWIDPQTGCQYHFWQSGSFQSYTMALAPRFGSDGKPMCGPETKQEPPR